MPTAPPLLVDTTSLLRTGLDRFDDLDEPDVHSLAVFDSLILHDRILLDGPSVERNREGLEWLTDVDEGIEILELEPSEVTALYRAAESVAPQIRPDPEDVDFMRMHMPWVIGAEVSHEFYPSTYWTDIADIVESDDLRRLQLAFEAAFGEHVPFSGAAFVTLARLFYYLALQQSLGSSLLLDPIKRFDTPQPSSVQTARSILDLFDSEVGAAFRERKARWLGKEDRAFSLPLLGRYVVQTAKKEGWSAGRVITELRHSREVELFRAGLGELQEAVDSNDVKALDSIFHELDAASASWSKQLGVKPRGHGMSVTVSLPFLSVGKDVPLPRLSRRGTSDKLLVFVDQLLSAA